MITNSPSCGLWNSKVAWKRVRPQRRHHHPVEQGAEDEHAVDAEEEVARLGRVSRQLPAAPQDERHQRHRDEPGVVLGAQRARRRRGRCRATSAASRAPRRSSRSSAPTSWRWARRSTPGGCGRTAGAPARRRSPRRSTPPWPKQPPREPEDQRQHPRGEHEGRQPERPRRPQQLQLLVEHHVGDPEQVLHQRRVLVVEVEGLGDRRVRHGLGGRG